MNIEEKITKEIEYADKKYGNFNSTHEVYGVLKEEIDEFFDVVKIKTDKHYLPDFKATDLISELIQISAIAKRAAIQLSKNQVKHV